MDIHTATEVAYKNGYLKGVKEVREETFWIEVDNNKFICNKCKAHSSIPTRFCSSCGRIIPDRI